MTETIHRIPETSDREPDIRCCSDLDAIKHALGRRLFQIYESNLEEAVRQALEAIKNEILKGQSIDANPAKIFYIVKDHQIEYKISSISVSIAPDNNGIFCIYISIVAQRPAHGDQKAARILSSGKTYLTVAEFKNKLAIIKEAIEKVLNFEVIDVGIFMKAMLRKGVFFIVKHKDSNPTFYHPHELQINVILNLEEYSTGYDKTAPWELEKPLLETIMAVKQLPRIIKPSDPEYMGEDQSPRKSEFIINLKVTIKRAKNRTTDEIYYFVESLEVLPNGDNTDDDGGILQMQTES